MKSSNCYQPTGGQPPFSRQYIMQRKPDIIGLKINEIFNIIFICLYFGCTSHDNKKLSFEDYIFINEPYNIEDGRIEFVKIEPVPDSSVFLFEFYINYTY
ncbi:MAG: hypothetical protein P5702_24335 [Limnospira sp. PMC 1291.21]|uniref:hypothetical protein n=1 Tax=Limnospira sp. PMC 1291.21 TaxID=2981074 RepID=UPI0028E109E4|nr:hypothetical protein [Limnospira sp. PMC 1291.21]MDT9308362.1 hypothetical protein [Limnospira sp. PMC 1291.21]